MTIYGSKSSILRMVTALTLTLTSALAYFTSNEGVLELPFDTIDKYSYQCTENFSCFLTLIKSSEKMFKPAYNFPKEWDLKPRVKILPMRVDDFVECNNCSFYVKKDLINPCSGLCPTCVAANPIEVREPTPSSSTEGGNGPTCAKCRGVLRRTNFGICRDVCDECMPTVPIKQQCSKCDLYLHSCWNFLCRGCRFRRMLCERVGVFFDNVEQHRVLCWCRVSTDE